MARVIDEADLEQECNGFRLLKVLNSEFETSTDGNVDSWLIAEPGESFSITKEKQYRGECSLKIETSQEISKADIRTEKIFTAREGYSYKASVMCFPTGIGNKLSIHIEFWKSDGMIAGSNTAICENKGLDEWQKLEVAGIAPVGTVMATILLQSDTASKGIAYFDCVRLEELPEKNMPNACRVV